MQSIRKIDYTITYQKRDYHFYMTDHIAELYKRKGWLQALTPIVRFIRNNFQNGDERFRLNDWFLDINGQIYILITPIYQIYNLLDAESQGKVNSLIFKITDECVNISHFGPFGGPSDKHHKKKIKDYQPQINKNLKLIEKKLKKVQEEKQLQKLREKPYQTQFPGLNDAMARRKQILDKIQRLRQKQNDLLKDNLNADIKIKVALKVAQTIAAQIAEVAAKQSAKMGVKKIPVVGLLAGLGFGIWRFVQGDVAGGFGQIASGAVSTIPGPGTAISVLIDAGLLSKDILELKQKNDKQLQSAKQEKRKIQIQIKNLQAEKLQAENQEKQSLKITQQIQIELVKNIQQLRKQIEQIENQLRELQKQKAQYEDVHIIKELAKLHSINPEYFQSMTDSHFVQNIKQFKLVLSNQSQKIDHIHTSKDQAMIIIFGIIIPLKYDKVKNLSELLIQGGLAPQQVKLIMQGLAKIQSVTIKWVAKQQITDRQVFRLKIIDEKKVAISLHYGINLYLSPIIGSQGKIQVNQLYCNQSQKFEQIHNGPIYSSFRASNGFCLNTKDEELYANKEQVGPDSTLQKIHIGSDSYAFISVIDKKFLSVSSLIRKRQIWKN